MGLLKNLSKKYRTVSIVGMAKNAGKTTSLNFLIEEAFDEGIRLGITSTGRDGETVDLVTETEKPKVYLYEDTVVSVPEQLFPLAEAGLEILKTTGHRTSLGELYLCRVKDSGFVQIAGPVATADTKKMCDEMLALGAELILIDGAIDRKSVAAPDSSDAVILATGAILSRDINKVAKETAHVVELYSLPELSVDPETPEGEIRALIEAEKGNEEDDEKILVIAIGQDGQDGQDGLDDAKLISRPLDLKTGLGSGRYINEAIIEDVRYIYIPGAFTGSVLADIDPGKLKEIQFILKDPTRIFMDSLLWNKMKKRGLSIKVLKNIMVCGITVNPISPEGYSFDSGALIEEIKAAVPEIPVIDVRKE